MTTKTEHDRVRVDRGTEREADPPLDGGLVVILWLLAVLTAEIVFWLSVFAHMSLQ